MYNAGDGMLEELGTFPSRDEAGQAWDARAIQVCNMSWPPSLCVWERGREGEGEGEREGERLCACICVHVCVRAFGKQSDARTAPLCFFV